MELIAASGTRKERARRIRAGPVSQGRVVPRQSIPPGTTQGIDNANSGMTLAKMLCNGKKSVPPMRSPLTARNHGTYRLPSRCSARCAECSYGQGSVAALACRVRRWRALCPYPLEVVQAARWVADPRNAQFFWGDFDWRHHHVRVDPDRFNRLAGDRGRAAGVQFPGNVWQHDPAHRRGVAYRDLPTRERFQPGAAAVRNREERLPFRGHALPQQQVTTTPGSGRPNLSPNNITGNRRTAVAPANPVSPRIVMPHNPPPAFTGLAPGATV